MVSKAITELIKQIKLLKLSNAEVLRKRLLCSKGKFPGKWYFSYWHVSGCWIGSASGFLINIEANKRVRR